jgi:hypothetical protein
MGRSASSLANRLDRGDWLSGNELIIVCGNPSSSSSGRRLVRALAGTWRCRSRRIGGLLDIPDVRAAIEAAPAAWSLAIPLRRTWGFFFSPNAMRSRSNIFPPFWPCGRLLFRSRPSWPAAGCIDLRPSFPVTQLTCVWNYTHRVVCIHTSRALVHSTQPKSPTKMKKAQTHPKMSCWALGLSWSSS